MRKKNESLPWKRHIIGTCFIEETVILMKCKDILRFI